jgi:hypothetical protein
MTTVNVTVTVTDSLGAIVAETMTLNINDEDLKFGTTTLPDGKVGETYSETVTAEGGTPPYVFTAEGLPLGLTIDSAGVISGTPTLS